MLTITATTARKSFFDLMKGVNQKHEIYHISHKNSAAVLMSEEEFESLQETLSLLSAKGFREDFERAKKKWNRVIPFHLRMFSESRSEM